MSLATITPDIYDSGAMALYERYWNKKMKQKKWDRTASNPGSIYYIKKYNLEIDWDRLSANPSPVAINKLKANMEKINWYYMSLNPSGGDLIYDKWKQEQSSMGTTQIVKINKDPKYLDWACLSANPAAISLLIENPDRINWHYFCKNPAAVKLITKELQKPKHLCRIKNTSLIMNNYAAIDLILEQLKKDPYMINWAYVFANPAAIEITRFIHKHYPERIDWGALYENPAAMDLISEHIKTKCTAGLLKQLGGYNYWTIQTKFYCNKATSILQKSDSWKDDIKGLFDRSNEYNCAKMDLEKYQFIKKFEVMQTSLQEKYHTNDTDFLLKKIKSNSKEAKMILDTEDPESTFNEMRIKRNLLSHEIEERNAKSNTLAHQFTKKEMQDIDDYRTLKHFSFIQRKLVELCDPNTCRNNKLITEINWKSKNAVYLLGPNAFNAYKALRYERNRIAHLIGERKEYM